MHNQEYNKILKLTENKTVMLGDDLKDVLNTELCLGMTRYVCRYGTLGEGHEKITPAQRYYQSIKEIWTRSQEIRSQKPVAKAAQGDLIFWDFFRKLAKISMVTPFKLWTEAKVESAHAKLVGLLVGIEDNMRQLDEFNKVRLELMDEVKSKYPSIEHAEHDNWTAVLEYRDMQSKFGRDSFIHHIPYPPKEKAAKAVELKNSQLSIEGLVTAKETKKRLVVN